jgi:hypothetical protein
MIQVTLKAKHFYYIVYYLKALPLDMYFDLINAIKVATDGKDDEDYVTVTATIAQVERIYGMLSDRPEGESNMINTEMNDILIPHLQDLINLGNEEAIALLPKLQFIRQTNWDRRDNAIAQAKSFLHS